MRFCDRLGRGLWARQTVFLVCVWLLWLCTKEAHANPRLRFQIDQRGDMVLLGNSFGFDCRPGIPKPVVGTVDTANCGSNIADSSADVWWRDDLPEGGGTTASPMTGVVDARTVAMLKLPNGAKVSYARLYFSGTYEESSPPDGKVTVERVGQAPYFLIAEQADIERNYTGGKSYQASVDVTPIVQKFGAGAYRVSGVPRMPATNSNADVLYAAWAMVVFYQKDDEPIRNLSLFEGLSGVIWGGKTPVTVSGFRVPVGSKIDAKLGVIAYEGDHDYDGDSLSFNGVKVTDGTPAAEDNFFNGSRTHLGAPVSTVGDLPQPTGEPGSMVGLDLDVIDVSPYVKPNDTQADLVLESTKEDVVLLGVLVTSIASTKPILETTLTYPQGVSTRPGDVIEFTSSTRNIGDAPGGEIVLTQALPLGLSYVPDSVRMTVAVEPLQNGPKTDKLGDDQVDWEPLTGTLRIRLGKGAGPTQGGTLEPGEPPVVVKYQIRIDDKAFGNLPVQSLTTAVPVGGVNSGPIAFPSGDGTTPGAPTLVSVPPCVANDDCSPGAPVCDTKPSPARCTDVCVQNADCQGAPGGTEVCSAVGKCVQCTPGSSSACLADGPGNQCLDSGKCGCKTNADCGGRTCDVSTNTCPKTEADLTVSVGHEPQTARIDTAVSYGLSVKNQSGLADPGPQRVTFVVQRGGAVERLDAQPGWRCSRSEQKVSCFRYRALLPNETAQVATFVVVPDPSSLVDPPSMTIIATVSSDGSFDPNPSDNTVVRTIELGVLRVAGGGLACSQTQTGSASGGIGLLSTVLLWGLWRFRRRKSNT